MGSAASSIELERTSLAQFVVSYNYNDTNTGSMDMQTKPRNALLAGQKYAKGEFKLPIYGKVSLEDDNGDELPPKTFEIKNAGIPGKVACVKASPSKEGEVYNPSASIHFVEDPEAVTAKIEWKVPAFSCGGKKEKIGVPVVVNTCTLNKGDEVTLLRNRPAKEAKSVKRNVMITSGLEETKKAKTA